MVSGFLEKRLLAAFGSSHRGLLIQSIAPEHP